MVETESTQIATRDENDYEFWIDKGVPYSITKLDDGSILGSICIPDHHPWYHLEDLSFYPDYTNAHASATYGVVKRVKESNNKALPDLNYRALALLTGFHIRTPEDEWTMEKMEEFLKKLGRKAKKSAKKNTYVNFRRHPFCSHI